MLIGRCEKCKKIRLFVRQREITIPHVNVKAVSNLKMCGKCIQAITKVK